MALYEFKSDTLELIGETSFKEERLRERQDIQRLLRDQIELIAPGAFLIAEEFGSWEDSRRRIDLLAIDKQANLIVIELKRTDDGGHMDLQSIRYAAMISAMTFANVVEAHSNYLEQREQDIEGAEASILNFLDWDEPQEEDFAQSVRIILCSGEFSREITTSVLWLNDCGLDITCMRIRPHKMAEKVIVNIEQIIPLPEADAYQVSIREKNKKARQSRTQNRDLTKFTYSDGESEYTNLSKRKLMWHVCNTLINAGKDVNQIRAVIKTATKFICGNGIMSGEEALEQQATVMNKVLEPRRFFTEEEERWHLEGKTYVLSKMWGSKTLHFIELLRSQWPDVKMSYEAER